MNKLSTILITLMVMLLFVPIVSADNLIVQNWTGTPSPSPLSEFKRTANNVYVGNDFLATNTSLVTSIQVQLERVNAITGEIWIALYTANASGFPVTLLANSTGTLIDASTLTASGGTGSLRGTNITPTTITSGTRYVIVLGGTTSVSATNYIRTLGTARSGADIMEAQSTFTAWANANTNYQWDFRLWNSGIASANATATAYNYYTNSTINSFSLTKEESSYNQKFLTQSGFINISPRNDLSGNNEIYTFNNQIIQNQTGWAGSAISLYEISTSPSISISRKAMNGNYSNYSISVAVKPFETITRNSLFGDNTSGYGYITIFNSSRIDFEPSNSDGKICSLNSSTALTQSNTWTVLGFEFSNDEIKLYRNGVYTTSCVPVSQDTSLNIENIGRGYTGVTNSYFNGTIDEIYIFNRSLSSYEFLYLYQNNSKAVSSNKLISYLPFEEIYTNYTSLINFTLSSDESGGYFNVTYTGVNVSSNVNRSLAQNTYTFYAVEKVTGSNVSGFNFTSVRGSTTYLTNVTHYMSNGTYQITPVKTGYYNITVPVTATNYFNGNQNVTGVYNQSLNLTVNYALNVSSVSSFSINISNSTYGFSESYNVSGNQITLNLTSNIIYDISVSVSDTFGNVTTFNSTLNQYNLTVYVTSDRQVNVMFYDEETLLPVNNVNYTVIGSTYSLSGSTTTTSNNINFTGLLNDKYEIRYTQNGGNYTYRSYFINIPLESSSLSNLSLYMLRTNSSTTFTLYVTDKYDLPQPNLTVSLLRRYPIGGQTVYYVVEQMQPSYALDGQTQFSGVANNVAYLFRVEDINGDIVFQGSGSTSNNLQTLYLISNPIYIRVTLDTNPFTVAKNLEGVSYNLTNTSTTFWFSVQDPSNVLSQVCLKVIGNQTVSVYDYCSTDTSTILSYSPTNGNNLSYYTAYGYVVIDGVQRILDSVQIDYRTGQAFRVYGAFGLFLALISIITISVAFADKPMFMVIGIALTLLALGSQVFGFIWLSPTLQATVLVLSIMVAYVMRNE